ncbi:Uncharacterised protein [Mycolicibacter terrae]|nr:Uncharacterised protein [Mycolicibacter terrae]
MGLDWSIMRTDQGRPLPPCELRAIQAAADEAGRWIASPGTRLRARWIELHSVLIEWTGWGVPLPTPAEWSAIVAAVRAARADEALARAAVAG